MRRRAVESEPSAAQSRAARRSVSSISASAARRSGALAPRSSSRRNSVSACSPRRAFANQASVPARSCPSSRPSIARARVRLPCAERAARTASASATPSRNRTRTISAGSKGAKRTSTSRERIVSINVPGAAVVRSKRTPSGGSSKNFSNAFAAADVAKATSPSNVTRARPR